MRRRLVSLAAVVLAAGCSDQSLNDQPLLGPTLSPMAPAASAREIHFAETAPLAGAGAGIAATPFGGLYADGDIQVTGKFIGDGSGLTTVSPAVHYLGHENTSVGEGALYSNGTGLAPYGNTAMGHKALYFSTAGWENTAVGKLALEKSTDGSNNTAIGALALRFNYAGSTNTAVGYYALYNNVDGIENVGMGSRTLYKNKGDRNAALGYLAGYNATSADDNIFIGYKAGYNVTSGHDNIFIANEGEVGDDGVIKVGSGGVHTRTWIQGIRGVTTGQGGAVHVLVDTRGQLGTTSSSRRLKESIADMAGASEPLLALRPVTFRYKKAFDDGSKPLQFGLIAEEVAEVFPELVVYDESSKPETVKYRFLSTLLLNELQKQVEANEQMQARMTRLEAAVQQLQSARAGIQQ